MPRKKKGIVRPSFEESIEIINSEIQKRKHRWHLTAIAWMDKASVANILDNTYASIRELLENHYL